MSSICWTRPIVAANAWRGEDLAKETSWIVRFGPVSREDMLATADPDKLMGDKVTVLQAMRAAVKELDNGSLIALCVSWQEPSAPSIEEWR